MGLFSPSPNLVNRYSFQTSWPRPTERSAPSRPTTRPQRPSPRVAIVAGYEPPVQRSDFGRRDPRFCSSPTETRFLTPPRDLIDSIVRAHGLYLTSGPLHALYHFAPAHYFAAHALDVCAHTSPRNSRSESHLRHCVLCSQLLRSACSAT